MKKAYKIMSVIMIILMLSLAISPILLATGSQIDADSITPIYGNEGGKITTIGQRVLGIITNIGIVLSVIVIAGLGIKYIMGSSEEKAEYKKSFIPLLVGMILLLSASAIAKFIITAASASA